MNFTTVTTWHNHKSTAIAVVDITPVAKGPLVLGIIHDRLYYGNGGGGAVSAAEMMHAARASVAVCGQLYGPEATAHASCRAAVLWNQLAEIGAR